MIGCPAVRSIKFGAETAYLPGNFVERLHSCGAPMITVKVTDGEIEEVLIIDGSRLTVTVGGVDVVLRNSLGDMTGESLWSTVANAAEAVDCYLDPTRLPTSGDASDRS